MVILGGGIAGITAGAHLRQAGVEKIRIIDQAGGIGGTWYWNRYPGVMCDVESYIYLPMLEELGYVPTQRYAFGEEIRPTSRRWPNTSTWSTTRCSTPGSPGRSGMRRSRAGTSRPTGAIRSAAAGTCWPSASST